MDSKNNQILFSSLFLRNYIIFGFFVMAWHFALLYFRFEFSLIRSIADALIFNILLDTFLLAIWFVVRFGKSESITSFNSLVNSILTAILLVLLATFSSHFILSAIFYSDPEFISYLKGSIPLKNTVGFFMAALVFLSFYLSIYQRSVQRAIERENELKVLVEKTQLQALKNQLNPHFIYNSLNSINSLTVYDPDKARQMIDHLSRFLRVALKQDSMALDTLEREIKNIELYLHIEKVRFEERLNWTIQIHDDHKQTKVPSLILQPLVENAVKHGAQQNADSSEIKITSQIVNSMLQIRIENSFDPSFQRFKGEGVGLENIRNRMKLIYGKNELFKIETQQKVFVAILNIPETKSN